MTLLCAGCAGFGSGLPEVVRRDLPPAPAYLRPVAVSEPRKEDMEVIAARERAGRSEANRIITRAREQWEKLRKTYARSR